ncbi:MAG: L-serine ammonia-lyase, iron-sulfur-dependent, subunit alpha [Acidaminococcaceae bacterium]|nr:L-serine ammonia-lyase, iron-sulfur-dependent, subunit alpha [Acidaminococcaceae bacterium]HBX74688.1 L-serine ammonia-lyase, iron-sulfur-dependent, subunit alpha [Acidaminococcaceae bacterium]
MKQDKLAWAQLVREAEAKQLPLTEYLLERSAAQLETDKGSVLAKLESMLQVMEEAVAFGLTGVKSNSGLTGGSAKKLKEYIETAETDTQRRPDLLGAVAGSAVTYALAAAEANAAMGRIVAAPTAGASGILPGVLLSLKENCGVPGKKLVEGLLVAGVIGEVIANRASIAGATGGCQAECGSGAAMAAGAVVHIFGGNGKQIGDAVSIVFKNMLGLVCDPVAGLVEVPCIKRNAGSVVQCLLAAELALAGVGSFIPADEAIDAMDKVGRSLPGRLRETAEGGLAVTPTAKAWTEEYFKGIRG